MAAKLRQNLVAFSGRILFISFLVLSLAMITVYSREDSSGLLHSAQNTVSGIFVPLKFASGALGSGAETIGTAVSNASASDASLEGLRAQNAELLDIISQLEEYRQEAQRLEALLGLKGTYSLDTLAARVISRGSHALEQVITIDKGSNDGVVTGLPVMGPSGVVGQVVSTSGFSADVRLLTDPLSGVSVLIQSSRVEGIVQGSLERLLYLGSIDTDAQVQVGDVVVTSGLGGSYFRGLTVGMVVKVDENQGGSTRKIVVAPNESTGPLEEVLVVLKMNSEGKAALDTQLAPTGGDENQTGSE